MECQSKLLIHICGCVLYYMPRINENTRICSQADELCYESAKLTIEVGANKTLRCHCQPGCFEISYTSEISAARLGTEGFSVRQKLISNTRADYVVYVSEKVFWKIREEI